MTVLYFQAEPWVDAVPSHCETNRKQLIDQQEKPEKLSSTEKSAAETNEKHLSTWIQLLIPYTQTTDK